MSRSICRSSGELAKRNMSSAHVGDEHMYGTIVIPMPVSVILCRQSSLYNHAMTMDVLDQLLVG